MLKLQKFRTQEILCAAMLLFSAALFSLATFFRPTPAYADDDEIILDQDEGREYFVTIYDDGATRLIKTGAVTIAEALEKSDIAVAETDIVEPGLDTVIRGDYSINIYRARPALVIDGVQRKYVMTASYDPKQIAIEAGLTVYDDDEVKVEFNDNFLEAGAVSTYRIQRNGGRTLTIEETIPYETEVRYDYTRTKGERMLEQVGQDGRRVSVYEVEFENNVEIARNLTEEKVLVEAIPEIIVEGAKVSIAPEQETCASWIREAGVSEEDLEAALELIYHESGCRVDATNASSGAYGIPQALPGTKMATAGDDWQTNPITQIRWMNQYVNRYGGWQGARDFWWCTGVCNGITKTGYWY